MIFLWITLLLLHQGYTLVPVKTVQLGEPVTFTCALPNIDLSTTEIYWYKQSVGDTLKIIVILWKSTSVYTPEFSPSRWKVNIDHNFSNLTILKTVEDDEGTYHCAVPEWIKTKWSGTYLLVKGNTRRTSNYTVEWATASHPHSATLQCSVLSDSENKTCPGDQSVFWFRAGSDESHPDIIYTDRNRPDKCEKRSDTQKSCVHRFSKTISSSDSGTYYCAVATCGEILFGKGTKLTTVQTQHSVFNGMPILIVCLAISVIGNVVLICSRNKQCKGTKSVVSEVRNDTSSQPVHDIIEAEDSLNYAALNFSERKATRGRNTRESDEDSVYSQVKWGHR